MSKKITIICKICETEFIDYKSNNRKFCSRECSDKGRDNRGLTGDSWYTAMSHVDMGKWRGKVNIGQSERMKGRLPWNTGKTNVQPKLFGENHPRIKKTMNELNLTWDEYNNWQDDKKRYRNEVWRISKHQPLNTLKHSDKLRGRAGIAGAYQLDHKISIDEGFKKLINPHEIGNIKNLQFITWEENLKKQNKEWKKK